MRRGIGFLLGLVLAFIAVQSAPGAAALATLYLTTSCVTGGVVVTGTVTLTEAAPTGGIGVTLASSDTTAATVPATVTVAAGRTQASFSITTKAVTSSATAWITASYGGVRSSTI